MDNEIPCIPLKYQFIIDVGYPMTRDVLQKVINVLTSNFKLISNLKINLEKQYGLALSAINNDFCKIYPFRLLDFNFNFITEGWKKLEIMHLTNTTTKKRNEQDYSDLLHLAIKSSLMDYKKFFNMMVQPTSSCSSPSGTVNTEVKNESDRALKIIFITSKTTFDYGHIFNTILSFSPNVLNYVEKLLVLKVSKYELKGITEELGNKTYIDKCNLLIETIELEPNELELHIKRCLFESQYHIGRLLINIPNDFVIHCEMESNVISGLNNKKIPLLNYGKDTKNTGTRDNIFTKTYNMEVMNKIMSDGVDESHLYGNPIRIIPARYFENDQNKKRFRNNLQAFIALRKSVSKSEEFLILKYTAEESPTPTKRQTSCYFLLCPGANNMLMKSLIPFELLLPEDAELNNNMNFKQANEVTQKIDCSLKKIKTLIEYNPDNFHAGLNKDFIVESSKSSQKCNITPAKRKLLPTISNTSYKYNKKSAKNPQNYQLHQKATIHPALLQNRNTAVETESDEDY